MSFKTLASLCLFGSALSLSGEEPTATADPVPASSWNSAARVEHWLAQLPPWLNLGAEVRGRFDNYFGLNALQGRDNSYYLHRLRLNAQASPAGWLRLVAQIQDSRQSGYDRTPVPYTVAQSLDLRQGYVELGGSGNEAPWTVRVGRQPLVFGDMRLVSTSNWGNVGPAFDAVRVSLRRSGVRLDGFSSLVVIPCGGFDRPRRDKVLSGFYSSFDLLKKTATVDVYVFEKRSPQGVALYTYGMRSAGTIADRLEYNVELALQRGHTSGESVAAWAGHWEIGRTFRSLRGSPRLAAEYNYASGDRAPRDGRYQSFDSLYPTNIYATAADFGWRNRHEPVVYLEWRPDGKTRFKAAYHQFWLAERQDALYTFAGSIFVFNPNATDARVGSDIDVRWARQMGKYLQLWVGYAHLFPGPYLKQAGGGAIDYPYAMWALSF